MKAVFPLLFGLLLLGQMSIVAASAAANESTPQQVAYGAGSVFGTLVYAPVKTSFCILGGVTSAFTAIASPPTAGKVARASCGGTWGITPAALKGREQIKYVGEPSR